MPGAGFPLDGSQLTEAIPAAMVDLYARSREPDGTRHRVGVFVLEPWARTVGSER